MRYPHDMRLVEGFDYAKHLTACYKLPSEVYMISIEYQHKYKHNKDWTILRIPMESVPV